MAKPTDAELVNMTRGGDSNAYKELVGRYQGHVYGLAYSLVNNWTDAQDITQETFIRAYMNLDQLREPGRFAGWLRRVAFSVAMNWLKAFRPGLFEQLDGRADLEHLEIPDFQPGPAEVAQKRELADAVLTAVASLPPKYRLPLTMFHLDGLSYQKVADFLDIPLGTAKSMIHRAKAKLEAALAAKEPIPMVQEVFNEHKLPEEFANKVLQNIAELSYKKTECTFCGSVCAYMDFLGASVPYSFVMGVSGSAFKLIWHKAWCPSNNTLLVLGLEPAKRVFKALGYEYKFVPKAELAESKEEFRNRIVWSIRKGKPVLAEGVVGPPEVGIITGFEQNADVLLGRSFFHESRDYYRKADWYKDCHSLLFIGEKTKPMPKRDILRETLEWAIQITRTSQMDWPGPERVLGLAAYDAWAQALLKDEDFPEGDLKTLTFRSHVCSSVTLCGLGEARRMTVKFLSEFADVTPAVTTELQNAAKSYEQELIILSQAQSEAPDCCSHESQRLKLADRGLREFLADHILQAKEKDQQAVEHLERTLEELQT